MSNCNSMTTKLFVSILFVLCVGGNGADALRADISNTQLTEEGLRKLATWSGESMNVEVDLTGGHPINSGTLKLKQGAPSSDGPVLLLN